MKKLNIAKVLFPFMLLGNPAIAGGSSIRSNSRFRTKKAVVQSSMKSTTKIIGKKEFKNPFGVFGGSKTIVKNSKSSQNNVLAFLNGKGLLDIKGIKQNIQSGDRKNFAETKTSCEGDVSYKSKIFDSISIFSYSYYVKIFKDNNSLGQYGHSAVNNIKAICNKGPVPSFNAGATNTLTVTKDSGATDIKDKLIVTDGIAGDTLTWSQNTAPTHGTLNFTNATASSGTNVTSGGTITYTPTANYSGTDSFVVQVSDGTSTDTTTVNVTVTAVNNAPIITSTPITSVDEDTLYSYTLGATDADNDNLTWSVTSGETLPSWLSLNPPDFKNVGTAGFSAGEVKYTSIAVDSSNTPYVVYRDYENSKKATVKKYNGTSWVNVGTAGFSAGEAMFTSIAFDSSNTPFVVYQDSENIYKATVKKYNGTSWVDVGIIGFSIGEAMFTSIAFDSSDTPYIVYQDGGNSHKVTVKKYNRGLWVDVGIVGFSAGGADNISIAFDSSNTPYVVYKNYGNSNKAIVKKYNGIAWVYVGGRAGLSAEGVDNPSIAFDSSDTPYVVYVDTENSNKATVKKYNGTSWVDVGTAGFGAGEVRYTSIAVDSSNTPYVIYQDVGNSNKATMKKYNGTTWVDVGTAGFTASTASFISMAFDSSDTTPYVVYQDEGNSNKATVMKLGSDTTLSGTPTNTDAGVHDVNLTLSDGTVDVAHNFQIKVIPSLVLEDILDVNKTEDDSSFVVELNATDKNGNEISFLATSSDTTIATVSITNNNLTVTPIANANGFVTIEVNATANGKSVMQSFDLNITAINDSPIITIDSILSTNENNQSSLNFTLTDVEDETLTLAIETNATHGSVTVSGNKVTYTPNENYNGTDTFTVSTTDSDGSKVTKVINVTVSSVNDSPVISIDPTITPNPIRNITKNANFHDFNISLTGISDEEEDDLNITFDVNDTSIIKISKNWNNSVSYADYIDGKLYLTVSSEANQSGVTEMVITINDGISSISKEFNITVVDTIPDNFNFIDKTFQERLSLIESNRVTIRGIDNGIDISILGGEYKINDANWTDKNGTINSDDNVTVRLSSSGDYSTTSTAILTIGDTTEKFLVTTESVPLSSGGGSTIVPIEEPSSNDIVVPVNEDGKKDETRVKFHDNLDVNIDKEDDVTTATIEIEDKKVEVAVNDDGTMDGKIEFNNEDGNAVSSTVKIELTKSETSVDDEGNIETTIKRDNDTTIKVRLGIDGSVKHVVESEDGTSVAVSSIAGSKVEIDREGTVKTTAQIEKNGFIYKAIVTTNVTGETRTKFVKINVATGEESETRNTLIPKTPYAAGSKTEINELDNMIYIKTTTPLDGALIIE